MACETNILLIFSYLSYLCISSHTMALDPTPSPWPPQFHSLISLNTAKGAIQVVDLWYDWPNGRNFNIIQNQLGKLLYDLEWNNGTSFYYTLDANEECKVVSFPVGILPPDWLRGGKYVGQRIMDGFLCNVWEKVEFIVYYEDVARKIPVHWDFFTGMSAHVMTFEVGAVLEDAKWQAPAYCFQKAIKKNHVLEISTIDLDGSSGALMKGVLNTPAYI